MTKFAVSQKKQPKRKKGENRRNNKITNVNNGKSPKKGGVNP